MGIHQLLWLMDPCFYLIIVIQMYVHYYERELMMERYGAFTPCGAVSLTYMDENQGMLTGWQKISRNEIFT